MSRSEDQINPNDSNRYSVIPRVLIFLFKRNTVLLIKGSPTKKLWAGKYNGLGGHIEKGEDPFGAAKRELLEECGLSKVSLFLAGTVIVDTGTSPGVAIYIFRGIYKKGEIISGVEGELEWVEIRKLKDFPVVEDLLIIIPLIHSMKAGDPPFSAKYYYDDQDQLKVEFSN